MTPLEKEILIKIRLGDSKAFEYIFKSYYSSLCRYACDLLKNADQAEEVVQDTLIRIWENRRKLHINTSIKSYLFRSVHNQCINLIKHLHVVKKQSDKHLKEVMSDFEITLMSEDEFTLDTFFYDGLENDIEKAIQSLPEQCRKIFRMSRFEMLSYEEIARKLCISVNTVKTQIRRALEKLRIFIEKKISEHDNDTDILK